MKATAHRRRGASLVVFVTMAIAMTVVSCALPVDSKPRSIERDRLPALLPPAESTTSVPTGATTATVFFLKGDRLFPVERKVKRVTPEALLEQLALGPTDKEQNQGISGPIPPHTRLISESQSDKVLTINVSKELLGIGSPIDTMAYGQIVYTMVNALPFVNKVSVDIEGKPTKIPTPDMGLVDEAGRASFTSISPLQTAPAATAPTTTSASMPPSNPDAD